MTTNGSGPGSRCAALPVVAGAGLLLAAGPVAAGEAAEGRTLAEWYALGGWVMHGLVAVSVLAVAVVLERAWSLRSGAVLPPALARALREVWDPRRPERARELCEASRSSLARLVRTGIGALERGVEHPLDHVSAVAEAESLQLRRNLPLLAALANLATMLGLLGTVLGMISAFDLIAELGTGDARVVARGIFEALVTTAAGLSVGIAALACHAFLRRRVDRLLLGLEEIVNELLDRPALAASEPRTPAPRAALAAAPQQS